MVEEIVRALLFFRTYSEPAAQKKKRAPASRLPETGGAAQRETEST